MKRDKPGGIFWPLWDKFENRIVLPYVFAGCLWILVRTIQGCQAN